jgi:uncharacterized protein
MVSLVRSATLSSAAAAHVRPADYILVKLAARCNLNCTYCYWFRDLSVYQRPPLLAKDVEDAFLQKLELHLTEYGLKSFYILFHGGEPTLFGKARFQGFCERLRNLEKRLGIALRLGITTNGILLDEEWISLLNKYNVSPTLSIDGPAGINDARRIDFHGKGTLERTVGALNRLRNRGVEPGVLAVCDPCSDPALLLKFFAEVLRILQFDVLVPDATHEDHPTSIAAYYKQLFDLWFEQYADRGVRIRYFDSIIAGICGYEGHSESIGYGPNIHFTMLTDGGLEALDTLRIVGEGSTSSQYNILRNEIQEVQNDPLWQEALQASVHLPVKCEACVYRFACGGGHIASRWSNQNRFDNPSVYCEDRMEIFRHVWKRIVPDLYLATPPPQQGAFQRPA